MLKNDIYPQVYSASDDELLGTIEQEWTCLDIQFVVRDQRGGSAFRIGGHCARLRAGKKSVKAKYILLKSRTS